MQNEERPPKPPKCAYCDFVATLNGQPLWAHVRTDHNAKWRVMRKWLHELDGKVRSFETVIYDQRATDNGNELLDESAILYGTNLTVKLKGEEVIP